MVLGAKGLGPRLDNTRAVSKSNLLICLKLRIGNSSYTAPSPQFYVLIEKKFQLGFRWTPPPHNWDIVLESASFFLTSSLTQETCSHFILA